MPPAGTETAIPASEGLQSHALDGAATGTSFVEPDSTNILNGVMLSLTQLIF